MKVLPFFIYGTLIPGQPNDHYVRDVITHQEAAVFPNGLLYAFPTFPMLIEPDDDNGMAVSGLLIEIDVAQYTAVVEQLDQLEEYNPADPENSPYTREIRVVQTSAGRTVQVWTYIGQKRFLPQPPQLIASGDWVQYYNQSSAQDSMRSWWLTSGVNLLLGKSDQSD